MARLTVQTLSDICQYLKDFVMTTGLPLSRIRSLLNIKYTRKTNNDKLFLYYLFFAFTYVCKEAGRFKLNILQVNSGSHWIIVMSRTRNILFEGEETNEEKMQISCWLCTRVAQSKCKYRNGLTKTWCEFGFHCLSCNGFLNNDGIISPAYKLVTTYLQLCPF